MPISVFFPGIEEGAGTVLYNQGNGLEVWGPQVGGASGIPFMISD